MAQYCAIPRDYLSDTPLLRAMGFLVSQHVQWGAIPPPPSLSVSSFENMRSGGAIPPPPQKWYLSDTCVIPSWKQGKWVRWPPLRFYLERVLRDMGGISHWAAKGTKVFPKLGKCLWNLGGKGLPKTKCTNCHRLHPWVPCSKKNNRKEAQKTP